MEDNLVAVMGMTGAGKSTFIRNMSKNESVQIGHCLEPCTSKVTPVKFVLNGDVVTLIDTPGFDDASMSDSDVLKMIIEWMSSTYRKGMKLKGIIYCHSIAKNRVTGSSLKFMNAFRKLCGDDCLGNVIMLTTMWDCVDNDTGQRREQDIRKNYWKHMIGKGSDIRRYGAGYAYDDTGMSILRSFMRSDKIILNIQKEIVDMKMSVTDTGALKCLVDEEYADMLKRQEVEKAVVAERNRKALEEYNRNEQIKRDRIRKESAKRQLSVLTNTRNDKIREISMYRDRMNSNCDEIDRINKLIQNTSSNRAIRLAIPFWTFVEVANLALSTKQEDRESMKCTLRAENALIRENIAEVNDKIADIDQQMRILNLT